MSLSTNDIRKKFLDFFKGKGHTIAASDSLVPKNDPTVLFTTAGMQQFKRQFLGEIDGFTRAATSQKCLRTDDLDEVGKTPYHHTFFEMLGNFSFGDYFKKEAIAWAWEFLTGELQIPKEKLWVSIYQDDEEAGQIWLNDIKIPQDKLVRLGDKSNFWPSNARVNGPNGPCGPCSEIFYDYGVNPDCRSSTCDPSCDCGRFSEIWNLVFTQFNRKDGGILEPLPSKNIDTGMGLERLVSVMQGKKSNFEIDIFEKILQQIDHLYKDLTIKKKDRYIIADHIRAVVFAINDGVIPSNKERGSVVKRLITDSTNIALSAGATEASVYRLVPTVTEVMGQPYPEIKEKVKNISELVQRTEEAFIRVRNEKLPELKEAVVKAQTAEQLGETFFMFRDTYGLPLPTILETADQIISNNPSLKNKAVAIYQKKMKEQQDRSRASSKIAGDVFTGTELELDVPKTEFTGYSAMSGEAKILKIFDGTQPSDDVSEGREAKVILDRTPFYAEAGGQIGDTGFIKTTEGVLRVTDTQKISGIYIHHGTVEKGTLRTGDRAKTEIDADRRLSIMRNHTATHLLQAALRTVLGTHVQQQGSLVAEDRLRFDFTHPQAITPAQIKEIESRINRWIMNCDPVVKQEMPLTEAKKAGALAFFAEKYGDVVRVVSINGYSKEFCGGTHLDLTGQIGLFKIISESAIAQGIRRLEAATGAAALVLLGEQERILNQVSQTLKSSTQDIAERVETQSQRIKHLEKNLERYRFESIKTKLEQITSHGETVGHFKIITHIFHDADMGTLRKVSDLIKQKEPSAVSVLGSRSADAANLLVTVADTLVKQGIRADEIIREIAPVISGSGGGRPQLAQAGSKDPSRLDEAVKKGIEQIKKLAADR